MKEFERQVLINQEVFEEIRQLPYFPLKYQEDAIYFMVGKDGIWIHSDFTGMNLSTGNRFYP